MMIVYSDVILISAILVSQPPPTVNFMGRSTNENDNGYAWFNVNPLMFSIFRNYFHPAL